MLIKRTTRGTQDSGTLFEEMITKICTKSVLFYYIILHSIILKEVVIFFGGSFSVFLPAKCKE